MIIQERALLREVKISRVSLTKEPDNADAAAEEGQSAVQVEGPGRRTVSIKKRYL